MTHDTAAVYTFVSVLLNDYLKLQFPYIEKVYYFSDGCCAQYKNYKNFSNLIFHHEHDFQLKAEWNFFATSHGKNSCDGVSGTINVWQQEQACKGLFLTKFSHHLSCFNLQLRVF